MNQSLPRKFNSGVEVDIFLCSVVNNNSFAFEIQFYLSQAIFEFVIGIAEYATP